VIVLTTLPADQDATRLAAALVEERLAACVNVLPVMTSIYRWEGKIEQAAEHQLVIKTTLNRVEALEMTLTRLHPYDVPELLVLPVAGGSERYLGWLQDNA
jgi:periplasmic divalent cation tolerance protein